MNFSSHECNLEKKRETAEVICSRYLMSCNHFRFGFFSIFVFVLVLWESNKKIKI